MGPHHPATHGVLRLLVTLQGEVVRDLKPIIGYVHTGIEKTAEDKCYWKVIPVVERMDYLAYYFNAMAFCGAVETLLEVEVPKRAQYLRVIHLELNRIMSPPASGSGRARSTSARSRSSGTASASARQILDLFEMSSGQRMHTRYFQVGGVIEDIPAGFVRKLREFLQIMPDARRPVRRPAQQATRSCCSACAASARWTRRRCSASASPARCCARPATRGTCARRRRTAPTRTSTSRSPSAPSATTTTATRVRMAEMYESVKIIEQALDGLPEGPYITEDRKVALPPRHELATSMEALIHHFKLVTEGFRVPPGEVYYPIESPARRARLLRALRRLAPSPRACTCATPRSSTCRPSRRWSRAPTSPT